MANTLYCLYRDCGFEPHQGRYWSEQMRPAHKIALSGENENDLSCMVLWKVKVALYGGVAQLGEQRPCKSYVVGSIPITSTGVVFAWMAHRNKKLNM